MAPQPRKPRTLLETAKNLPLESILHALPIVGMLAAPFDLARAANQATEIKDLRAVHGDTLRRDLNAAVRSGALPVRRGFRGPNSVEFATQQFLAARARRQRALALGTRRTRVTAIAAQRVLSRRAA